MENRAHVKGSHLPQPPGGSHPQQESRATQLGTLPGVRSVSKTDKTDGQDIRVVCPQSDPQSKVLGRPSLTQPHPQGTLLRSGKWQEGKPQAGLFERLGPGPLAAALAPEHTSPSEIKYTETKWTKNSRVQVQLRQIMDKIHKDQKPSCRF